MKQPRKKRRKGENKMKREELKAVLGESVTPEQIDKIMEMNGVDINKAKADYQVIVNERDTYKQKAQEYATAKLSSDDKDKQIAKLTKDLEEQKEEYEAKIMVRQMEDARKKLIGSVKNCADTDLLSMAVDFGEIDYDTEKGTYDEKAFNEQVEKLRKDKPILFTDGAGQGPIGKQPKTPEKDISKLTDEDLINL